MSRALSKDTAGSVRIVMWPYLFLLLGPPLVPIWVAGLVALWRRPAWRAVRFLPLAFAVLLLETFAGGGQLYYPFGLLAVVYAAGCVPAADFLARSRGWRCTAWVAICVNAAVSAVIALPLLPASVLGRTPVPGINQLARDQIGWPEYVSRVAAVYRTIPPGEALHTVIITSKIGRGPARSPSTARRSDCRSPTAVTTSSTSCGGRPTRRPPSSSWAASSPTSVTTSPRARSSPGCTTGTASRTRKSANR